MLAPLSFATFCAAMHTPFQLTTGALPMSEKLTDRLLSLADCDARAGEPLGKAMREAAGAIMSLSVTIEEQRKDLSTLRARVAEVERERDEGLPWVLAYRDGLSLGDIASRCGGSIYDYSPWLFAPLSKGIIQMLDNCDGKWPAKAVIEAIVARAEAAERRLLPEKLTEEQRERLAMALCENNRASWFGLTRHGRAAALEGADRFHAILTRIEGEK